MPASRINRRKPKDALHLTLEGQPPYQRIATTLGISNIVGIPFAGLALAARLDWPSIAAMDEARLERRLRLASRPNDIDASAHFCRNHQKQRRMGMTSALIWEEYCAETGRSVQP